MQDKVGPTQGIGRGCGDLGSMHVGAQYFFYRGYIYQ